MTSGTTNYSTTRDQIIHRSLRIINEIGTGETADPTRITECAIALNDVVKEFEADGMQLWKIRTLEVPFTLNEGEINIGIGLASPDVSHVPPLKIIQGIRRFTTSGDTDTPIIIFTKQEYDQYGAKLQLGVPNQLYYRPPGSLNNSGQNQGTIFWAQVPSQDAENNYTSFVTGQFPIEDFDAGTDVPDFPQYYYNAVVWALADQLAYETGLPLAERSMITKKAHEHLERAKGFDVEEGSLYLQPHWEMDNYRG